MMFYEIVCYKKMPTARTYLGIQTNNVDPYLSAPISSLTLVCSVCYRAVFEKDQRIWYTAESPFFQKYCIDDKVKLNIK